MKATTLAKLDNKLRHLVTKLPPKIVVSGYSSGRLCFLEKLKKEVPSETYIPPENFSRELWGIKFRSPIMNAAGMFKNGECYDMVAKQGAAAYLGGTGTWSSRIGNEKDRIYLPFVPYPRSHSSSNWLGLPNDGDEENSKKAKLERIEDTPICWSVMDPNYFQGEHNLKYLVDGMRLYELACVDLLEINESCPNTSNGGKLQDDDMANRLKYVKEHFLDQRTRRVPVVVKFSNDTRAEQLPLLLDLLFDLAYDGVNFGNTSTDYTRMRERIDSNERKLFDFFTKTFGGGISGKPLRESSLELASRAVEYTRAGPPPQEFHVIRTGGIETLQDIQESERAGILLNQWFTGYFENFSKYGHNLYKQLFESKSSSC